MGSKRRNPTVPSRPARVSARTETTSTAGGGARKAEGGTSIPIETEGLEGITPPPSPVTSSSWNPQTVGVVLASVIAVLAVVFTAASLLKDIASLDKSVEQVSGKVEGVSNKTVEIGAKVDGIQSSLNEVRRDLRDDSMGGRARAVDPSPKSRAEQ